MIFLRRLVFRRFRLGTHLQLAIAGFSVKPALTAICRGLAVLRKALP